MKRLSITIRVTVAVLFYVSTLSCRLPLDAPPNGGIRVETYIQVVTIPSGLIAAPAFPGVFHNGFATNTLGRGTGTELVIGGITNALGFMDYPFARTNAIWEIVVGPTSVPPCAARRFIEEVPDAGGTFRYVCFL